MITIILICLTILGAFYIILQRNTHPGLLLFIPFIISTSLLGLAAFNFEISGVLRKDDITLILIFLLIPFFANQDFVNNNRSKFYHNYGHLFIYLIIYFFIVLVFSIIQYNDIIPSIKTSRAFLRYIVFFPLLYIIFRIKISEIEKLFAFIEKLTLILGTLYILDFAFGLEIFASASNTNILGGESVQRNFLAFPIFTFYVLARLSLKEKITKYEVIGIIILMIDIFLTLTRSLAVAGMATVFLGTYYRGKLFAVGKIFRRLIITSVSIGGILVIVIILLFDQELAHFNDRLQKVSISAEGIEASTLETRFYIIESRIAKVWEVNPFTGLGYVSSTESRKIFYPDLFVHSYDRPGSIIVNDQSWGSLIGSVGFIGLILYLSLFFYPFLYIIRRNWFFNLHKEFYPVFIALVVEFFSRSIISENLFGNLFQIVFFLILIAYFIELKNDKIDTPRKLI